MPWIREGYCCRCGECCVSDPFDDENRPRPVVVPGYCPFFEWHGEKQGFCATHAGVVPEGSEHSYYRNACAPWPEHPDQIADKPSCTYTFRWVDD